MVKDFTTYASAGYITADKNLVRSPNNFLFLSL